MNHSSCGHIYFCRCNVLAGDIAELQILHLNIWAHLSSMNALRYGRNAIIVIAPVTAVRNWNCPLITNIELIYQMERPRILYMELFEFIASEHFQFKMWKSLKSLTTSLLLQYKISLK